MLLFLILTVVLVCKTKPEDKYFWYSPKEVIANADKLQPGDILILSKEPTLRSMWGHAAVLNENKKIVGGVWLKETDKGAFYSGKLDNGYTKKDGTEIDEYVIISRKYLNELLSMSGEKVEPSGLNPDDIPF